MKLLASKLKGDSNRKNFVVKTKIKLSTRVKEESFRTLQKALLKPTFLAHFNSNKTLYINLDANKRFNFEVIIYHISYNKSYYSRNKKSNLKSFYSFRIEKSFSKKEESTSPNYSSRSNVKLILFLSRLLKNIETRY